MYYNLLIFSKVPWQQRLLLPGKDGKEGFREIHIIIIFVFTSSHSENCEKSYLYFE